MVVTDCDGTSYMFRSDQIEVVLTAMDSYGDGWQRKLANVYFDGVLFDPMGVGFTYDVKWIRGTNFFLCR